jgi:SRSO17 transposase
MVGWVLRVGRHTVTGVIQAAEAVDDKHYTSFHRFFRSAKWSPDTVGLTLLKVVLQLLPRGEPVRMTLDDTLARHTGKHISSAGMHVDPLLSTKKQRFYHFGHVWVVLSVVVDVPLWKKRFALPVLARLYRTEKLSKAHGLVHRKRTDLGAELVRVAKNSVTNRKIVVIADATYVNGSIIKPLPEGVVLVGRGRLDAALYSPPEHPKPGQMGRPRVKGQRLPSPLQRTNGYRWKRLKVKISGREATVRIQLFDALWYKAARQRLLRFALIRDWPGHKRHDVLVTTNVTATAEEMITTYCQRWPTEETFAWVKQRLGFQDPQNRTEHAVHRTAPMALWAYSLIVLWYLKVGHRSRSSHCPSLPWYSGKKVPSFADMLATLRRESWRRRVLVLPSNRRRDRKSLLALLDIAAYGH